MVWKKIQVRACNTYRHFDLHKNWLRHHQLSHRLFIAVCCHICVSHAMMIILSRRFQRQFSWWPNSLKAKFLIHTLLPNTQFYCLLEEHVRAFWDWVLSFKMSKQFETWLYIRQTKMYFQPMFKLPYIHALKNFFTLK